MTGDRDFEIETVVRWSRAEPATLWTADASEARRWKRLGYPVVEHGERSWRCEVTSDCVALLELRAGAARIPRYLDPPVVRVARVKGPAAQDAEKTAQNR